MTKNKNTSKKDFTTKSLDGIKNIYDNKFFKIQKPETHSKKLVVVVIMVALIFGILAGLVGGGIILVTRRISIPFVGEYNLEDHLPEREITIETVRDVTVTEETRVSEVIEDGRKKTVDIFVRKNEDDDILNQVVSPNEIIARGVVLSSDGWIITLDSEFDFERISYLDEDIEVDPDTENADEVLSHDYSIITYDGKIHSITKALRDPHSKIVFLKTDGIDLNPAKIGSKDDLTLGEALLVFTADRYLKTEVGQKNYQPPTEDNDIIKSSDKFHDFVLLTEHLSGVQVGSPAIDLSGAVIGLMMEKDMVMPTLYLRNLVTQVLSGGSDFENKAYLSRPYFGIDYIDLHQQKGITDERFSHLTSGALVYGNPIYGSPAAVAGIKNADVVLKINGENVNGRRNLSELIWQYNPGSTLEVKVLSGGEEKEFKIVLDELELELESE